MNKKYLNKIRSFASQIVDQLESMREDTSSGTSFRTGWYDLDQLIYGLLPIVGFSADVCEVDRHRICSRAIFDEAKKGPLRWNSLNTRIQREKAAFEKTALSPFLFVTSISLRGSPCPEGLRLAGATIRFTEILPKKFLRTHVPSKLLSDFEDQPFYKRFLHVIVRLRARSESEALLKSSDVLSLLRGMWNFSVNQFVTHSHTSNPTKPLNEIVSGPVSTLHFPNGQPATQTYLYQPFFDFTYDPITTDSKVWKTANIGFDKWRKVLQKSNFRSDLERVFIRYCRAADNQDHENTFLQLWSLLEQLTSTTASRGYDETIKRVAALYAEPGLDEMLLELFRFQRNSAIHSAISTWSWRDHASDLHRYVAQVMTFVLYGSNKFTSLAEAGAFLSLPRDQRKLKRDIYMRKFALKFRSRK